MRLIYFIYSGHCGDKRKVAGERLETKREEEQELITKRDTKSVESEGRRTISGRSELQMSAIVENLKN